MRLNMGWQSPSAGRTEMMYWCYRMINTSRPLQEEMALFWQGLLCTGLAKVDNSRQMGVKVGLEQMGGVEVSEDTRRNLIEFARQGGQIITGSEDFVRRTAVMLGVIVATKEYQLN